MSLMIMKDGLDERMIGSREIRGQISIYARDCYDFEQRAMSREDIWGVAVRRLGVS